MSVTARLILAFLTLVIVPLFFLGVVSEIATKGRLQEQVTQTLETVSGAQKQTVTEILKAYFMTLDDFIDNEAFTNARVSFGENPGSTDPNQITQTLTALVQSHESYVTSAYLFDEQGKSLAYTQTPLASSINMKLLKNESGGHAIILSSDGVILSSSISLGTDKKGILVLLVNPKLLTQALETTSTIGKTAETILAARSESGKYMLLTKSGFSQAPENTEYANEDPIAQAINENETVMTQAIDHRDELVIASTRYIKEAGWGMVTKIDRRETTSYLSTFSKTTYGVIAVVLMFTGLIAWFIIRSIALPLSQLSKTTKALSHGNLEDMSLSSDSFSGQDEFGQLAHSFMSMNSRLKDLYGGLEKQVKEKTGALQKDLERLEAQKTKDEKILGGIADGVCAIEKTGNIILLNDVGSATCGFQATEAIGKPYRNILKFSLEKDPAKAAYDYTEQALAGKRPSITEHLVMKRKDGATFPVSVSIAPVFDAQGNVSGAVIVFRDISREREIEKLKDEFVSMASHELRTPMTTIKGFLYLVLTRDKQLSQQSKDWLTISLTSTERLIALVNDMLDVSRIESGRTTLIPQPLNIVELVLHVKQEFASDAGKHNLVIVEEKEPLTVLADKNKISQVLINIIGNSLKFTPEKGTVTVSFKKMDQKIAIIVSDTGIGIKAEDKEKLFTKFGRLDTSFTSISQIPGTGLGLYISKKIIELSGGEIWVDSEVGHGSTFTFTLPQATEV